jgi:hypothetical protein
VAELGIVRPNARGPQHILARNLAGLWLLISSNSPAGKGGVQSYGDLAYSLPAGSSIKEEWKAEKKRNGVESEFFDTYTRWNLEVIC